MSLRIISFKLNPETDTDLIAWMDALNGNRSDTIRDALRAYMTAPQQRDELLSNVSNDVQWIQQTLNDMPAYLESIIRQVAHSAPMNTPASEPQETKLNSEEITRRAKKLKKASW